jgi:hypothetical protein
MPFIGKQPQAGAYSKLDAITTSATATYNLTLDSGAYYPQSANHLLVSLNGVLQAPQDSFTVSGSQITFDSALTSSDSIDFIMALGDTLDIGVPSAGSVDTSQLANGAVTSAKLDTNIDIAGTLDVTGATTLDSGLTVDANGATVLTVDRATSDGEIINFRKDGTQVGSIDSRGGIALTLNSESGNGRLAQGGTAYYEWNTTRLSPVTDTVGDLGRSVQRWKDLYLSGGVYVGGTGSANYLDDYEEGTWTPTLQNYEGTPTIQSGNYTKIGRMVFASIDITLDGTSDASGFAILGLPFTSLDINRTVQGGFVNYTNSSKNDITVGVVDNSAAIQLYQTNGTTYTYNEFGVSSQIRFSVIYATP